MGNEKIYSMVTDQIIEQLEKGVVPWSKPWDEGASCQLPTNIVSKKSYRGINIWLLMCRGFSSRFWATFKQVNQLGGSIKPGEHGTVIVFWKPCIGKDKDTQDEFTYYLLRYYKVFNLEQTTGIEDPDKAKTNDDTSEKEFNPIQAAEEIVDGFEDKPQITEGGSRACYSPELDKINMPPKASFKSEEYWYTTLFHELTHSTGHEDRVGRKINNYYGDNEYSLEELVAEMGASFLNAKAGIHTVIKHNASYISGWLEQLRNDKKFVVQAAAKAQKATDYILGVKFKRGESNDKKEAA